MLMVSLPLAFVVIRTIRETNYDVEEVVHVEDVPESEFHGAAVPTSHKAGVNVHTRGFVDEKPSTEVRHVVGTV